MKENLFIILIFVSHFSKAQMINIESSRLHTDSIRFASKNEISSSYNDNNGSYVLANSISSTSQFKTKNLKNIFLILGNYNSIISKNENYQNSWLVHTRFNHKINNWFGSECFFQYGENRVLDVSERMVIGAGLRFKLISKNSIKFYLGESLMCDFERNNIVDTSYYNYRNNFYVSTTINIIKSKLELISTLYWQAVYSNLKDYNVLNQFKINYSVTKKLNIFFLMDYFLDSKTPLNRSQYYYNNKFGIGINI